MQVSCTLHYRGSKKNIAVVISNGIKKTKLD